MLYLNVALIHQYFNDQKWDLVLLHHRDTIDLALSLMQQPHWMMKMIVNFRPFCLFQGIMFRSRGIKILYYKSGIQTTKMMIDHINYVHEMMLHQDFLFSNPLGYLEWVLTQITY